jgi:hypothetical protein
MYIRLFAVQTGQDGGNPYVIELVRIINSRYDTKKTDQRNLDYFSTYCGRSELESLARHLECIHAYPGVCCGAYNGNPIPT